MKVLVLMLVLSFFYVLTFSSTKYSLFIDHVELYYYNKQFIANPDYSYKKYNRTNYGLNITVDLLEDFGNETYVSTFHG